MICCNWSDDAAADAADVGAIGTVAGPSTGTMTDDDG